jgi:hypothetical protein
MLCVLEVGKMQRDWRLVMVTLRQILWSGIACVLGAGVTMMW